MKKVLTIFSFVVIAMCSCEEGVIKDASSYMRYMADPENGLIKEKTVGGLKIRVKYLPSAYMAYNIAKNDEALRPIEKDSLIKRYSQSLTFLVSIGPAEDESFDITRVGVKDYQEFSERVEELLFASQEWMQLEDAGKVHKAALVRMENLNSQKPDRDFIVVFDKKEWEGEELCFHYNDELYQVGKNKFVFNTEELNAIPEFKF